MGSYSSMTDNPLVEAVARAVADCRNDFRRSNDKKLAEEGFWPDRHAMPSDSDTANAALRAIEGAGYRLVKADWPY